MGDHVRRKMIARITQVIRQNPAYRPVAHQATDDLQWSIHRRSFAFSMYHKRGKMARLSRYCVWLLLSGLGFGCTGTRGSIPAPMTPAPASPEVSPSTPSPVGPQSWIFRYLSGTGNYLITRSATIEREDSVGDRDTSTNITHELITFQPTDSGTDFTAVVDTFATAMQRFIDPGQPFQLPIEVSGSLIAGKVTIITPMTDEKCSPAGSVIITDLHNLLISFPSLLTPGISWRDSVDVTGCQMGIQTSSHTVRTFLVSGAAVYAKTPVVLVLRTDTTHVEGQGALQQHQISIEADGSGAALYYIDPLAGRIIHIALDQKLNFGVATVARKYRFSQKSKQDFRMVP